MNLSRVVSRVSRQLLSSFSAARWPCRSIQTGIDQAKFGRVTDTYTDCAELDVFLGKWQLEKMIQHRSLETSTKPDIRMLPKNDPNRKAFLVFKKTDDMWTFEIGGIPAVSTLCYDFYLGVDFVMLYPNGKQMQTVIYPEGRLIRWEQQNLDVPSDMVKIITEVQGRKLIWKTRYVDGRKLTKQYIKV